MRVYEYAKQNDMTNKEVMEKFGVDHHMDLIPEEVPETYDAPEVPKEAPKKPKKKAKKADDKDILSKARALRTGIGDKTKAFLEFVSDNKEVLPEEHQRVIILIERYL